MRYSEAIVEKKVKLFPQRFPTTRRHTAFRGKRPIPIAPVVVEAALERAGKKATLATTSLL